VLLDVPRFTGPAKFELHNPSTNAVDGIRVHSIIRQELSNQPKEISPITHKFCDRPEIISAVIAVVY
jgi:hypothetical protein